MREDTEVEGRDAILRVHIHEGRRVTRDNKRERDTQRKPREKKMIKYVFFRILGETGKGDSEKG